MTISQVGFHNNTAQKRVFSVMSIMLGTNDDPVVRPPTEKLSEKYYLPRFFLAPLQNAADRRIELIGNRHAPGS